MNQSGLAHHKARFLGLIENDEEFANESLLRCDQMEEAIIKGSASHQLFFLR